jgi:predicted membrane-bound spermidine synthase
MKPVFIVSRIFPTAIKHLEQQGAVVIEAEAQFYQKKYWAIARNLKQNLGYHFVRRVGHPKQIAVLSQKLSQVLV